MADLYAPLSSLQWVERDLLKPNDYNPNRVSKENLKLLTQSIMTNGWTLPIVVRPDYTIIDGFHRWTVAGEEPLRSMLGGKVPVVIVDHPDHADDIYGTVTHNRARGTHLLEPMKAIVKELIGEGKPLRRSESSLECAPRNSPSKVMRDQIGVMISRGLAVGITDGSRDVIKSANSMTNDLNSRILSNLSGLSFGSIGIPDIATGSVVPYKVAAASMPTAETDSEVAVLRRDIGEYMDEQGYVLKQILELLRRLNLTIDAEGLSDLIGAIMTNRERSYGV